MATAVSAMSFNPFANQCEPDMDSWLELSMTSPPTTTGPSQIPISASPSSAITSPATTVNPLDQIDEQTPAKPSHEYDRFKQQTGLPSNSVPGIEPASSSAYRGGFSSSGLDIGAWGMDFDSTSMDMELSASGSGLPAFFYPPGDASQSDDYVDPSSISSQEETQPSVRFWPGMHQQQAALAAKAAQAQQQAQQAAQARQQQMMQQQQQQKQQQQAARAHQARRSASHQSTDARTEETIARVVNQIRQSSQLASQHAMQHQGSVLPHIVKMKKDEDDMDEDERLLASEEGKKLSSKERRQLRNKVSARAFRSRRKEYIGQLEGEVAIKVNEANDLRIQNQALMEENARSRAFIEKLLRHPAFTPFLEDLSRDESVVSKMPMATTATPVIPTTTAPPQHKEVNPYAPQQFQDVSRPQNLQIGMALVPETPLDLSALNLGGNWSMPANLAGFSFQQPQVFAVTEVPEGPVNPLNVEALSGKGYESVMDETAPVEEVKHDVPVVKTPVREAKQAEAKPAESDEDKAFDSNPAFALFHSAPSSSDSTPVQALAPVSEKPHFALVVENPDESEALMARLDRMISRMAPVYDRIASMTAHLEN